MGFIRVRAVDGPLHEFDVSEAEYAATPDVYEVLDPEPVADARYPRYVTEPEDGAEPDVLEPTAPAARKK